MSSIVSQVTPHPADMTIAAVTAKIDIKISSTISTARKNVASIAINNIYYIRDKFRPRSVYNYIIYIIKTYFMRHVAIFTMLKRINTSRPNAATTSPAIA